jgi:polar amino acid transport system substrate-binding protein
LRRFIFSTLVVLLFSPALMAETTIRITNGEWEPYLSEYSYKYGLASHIVTEAFKLEGITVKWGFFPWKRAYLEAQKGENWDASAVWWPTEERKESFFLSDALVKTSYVFFHLKSRKFEWKSVEDLKGLKIGTTLGYDYGKELMTAMKDRKISFQEVSSDEKNFDKLLLGRIDIFPNNPIVGAAQIINSLPPEEAERLTYNRKEFDQNNLNLLISKKCANGQFFLEKFNTGMKKLKESGRLAQMYKDLDAGKYDKQKTKWKE